MQDARGASLSDAEDPSQPDDPHAVGESVAPAQRPSRVPARLVFAAVAVVLLTLDQVTKVWAVASLSPGEPRDLIGSLLRLNLVRNPGAAFSTGEGFTEVFTVLAVVATGVTLWFAFRTSHRLWAVAFGFLLAGVAGNLVDRLTRTPGGFAGHVVDFLELPNWPVFNVADMCINVAAVLILVLAWRNVPLDPRPSGRSASDEAPSAPEGEQ